MTDSELLDRVAAWLASRGLTPTPGEGLWDACSGSWGASSPPALGCLLAMVREAWGDPEMSASGGEHTGWSVCHGSDRGDAEAVSHGGTEAAALVAALEAAPQPGTVTP